MSRFRKFTDWLWLNQWIAAPIMYVGFCIYMYMTATVTINGVALPQHDVGVIALITWHAILLVAFAGAWLLHKTVDNFVKIRDYFRKIRKNKK